MALEQLIYTSCKTGIMSQGAGFQVYSHSENLRPEQVLAIQKYVCQYKEPFNLPGKPTQEEIEQLFPTALRYMPLDDATSCIAQSKYIGRDYASESGRFGIFITHVLVADRQKIDFYPIELLDSFLFRSDLDREDKQRTTPPPLLDPVPETDVAYAAGLAVNFETVRDFIAEDFSRMEVFKTMIAAVIESASTGKRILICDEKDNIPKWIAALTMAFPVCCARDLPFTTYTFQPDDTDALICGVLPEGTYYSLQNAQASGLYYLFDFAAGSFAQVQTQYAVLELIETGFEFSKDSLDSFHGFLTKIKYARPDEKIDAAYRLYMLYNGDYASLSGEQLYEALSFAGTCTDADVLRTICEGLLRNADDFIDNATFQTARAIYTFLKAGAASLRDAEIEHKTKRMLFDSILKFVNEYDVLTTQAVDAFYTSVAAASAGEEARLLRSFFMTDVSDNAAVSLSEGDTDPYHNLFFARLCLRFMRAQELTLREFTEGYRSTLLREIFANLHGMRPDDALACTGELLGLCGENETLWFEWYEALTQALGEEMEDAAAKLAVSALYADGRESRLAGFMRYLAQERDFSAAYAVYSAALYKTEKPRSLFWTFYENCLCEASELAQPYLDPALTVCRVELLKRKEDAEYAQLLAEVLPRLLQSVQSQSLAGKLVYDYERTLDLRRPDEETEKILEIILDCRQQKQLLIVPDKTTLIALGLLLERLALSPAPARVKKYENLGPLKFTGVTQKEVENYLDWVLSPLLRAAKTAEECRKILNLFGELPAGQLAEKSVDAALAAMKKEREADGMAALLFAAKPIGRASETAPAFDKLASALARLPEKRLEEIDRFAAKAFAREPLPAAQKEWDAWMEQIARKRESSFLGKVKGLFGKDRGD